MNRLWKDLRTNMMYWRFRHITRNRHRLKSWRSRRRQPTRRTDPFARPWDRGPQAFNRAGERGMAAYVYSGSQRRSLTAFAALILLLTGLMALVHRVVISPGIVYGVGSLIVIGTVYYALRGI